MDSKDWNNLNQIFSNNKVKKEGTMDEVEWDKVMALHLEERRQLLLDEYEADEERPKEEKDLQQNRGSS
tara:strand:+ start:229 stop:435 length:207 start_codon:yes stop_codon:yes gene_type:complete